jgi:hypothetical protein
MKSEYISKVIFLKTFKKKVFPEKLRSKNVFCTRVVEKVFFDIVASYTIFL